MPLGVITVSMSPVRFPTAASLRPVTADIADIPHCVSNRPFLVRSPHTFCPGLSC